MSATTGLLDAMLAVQAAAPTLEKDRTVTVKTKTGGEYTYSYTPLDSIVEKVGPLLAENGLVWMTRPSWGENIGPTLKYKIAHAPSKEFEEGEMPLMLGDDPDAQAMGSAITYMRRYALCAVLNLVADMDDDGAAAGRGKGGGGKARPASEKQIGYVKTLFKQKKATTTDIRAMLRGVGLTIGEKDNPIPLVDALTGPQASEMIEFLKEGKPVPTGESDVPTAAPGEFEHPPAGDDPDIESGARQFDVGPS